jgi:glycine/D-amino acid oxidase-like deaminating enzyme
MSFGAVEGWGQRALLRRGAEGVNLRTVGESAMISGQITPVLSRAQDAQPHRARDFLRYARLEDALGGMFPMMKGAAKPGYRFSAVMFRTADGLPIIGPAEGMPGIYTVCGYGADGATAGVIAGRLLTSYLRGDKPSAGKLYGMERL